MSAVRILLVACLVWATSVPAATADPPCTGLYAPVNGPIARPFAPIGRYAGHWGVDLAVPAGTPVAAAGAGVVSFAGTVAERLSVTVDHGGGLRTSYSYLDSIVVRRGAGIDVGTILGGSGIDHDIDALHFSVRVDGEYEDPMRWLSCHPPGDAVRLAPRWINGGP